MRKRIIIITSRFPFPLEKGDKLRIFHQIKYLAKYHDIYLVSLNTGKKIPNSSLNELKKYCKKIYVINIDPITQILNLIKAFLKQEPLQVGYFYSKKAHQKIQLIIQETKPDWCYAQLIRTAKYIQYEKNNIIDYMDTFSKGIERRIDKFPFFIQPIVKREYKITQKYEHDIFKYFTHHTIITKNDRKYIKHINKNDIKVVPNGVDTKYFQPNKRKRKKFDLIFVGNMSYPPNIEAAVYLCEKIVPIIKKTHNDCKILIGGANPHHRVKRLQNKNIKISGWVNDIRDIYASGRIFVAPMFMGTGLQNKLLEAMAMGIPCITTKLANKALLANESQIIIAQNEIDFAKSCINLLKDEKLYKNLKNNGLNFVKKNYEWDKLTHHLNILMK